MTEQAATNGFAEKAAKAPSALDKLLSECKGKKVNESDKKKVTNDFVKAQGEREKLQAALDAFDAKADDTAANMVRCYGSAAVTVQGVRYIPTSRGERVYYKKMTDHPKPVIALD